MILILILLLALFQNSLADYMRSNPDYYQLDAYTWESDEFRALKLGPALTGRDALDADMAASLMIEHHYDMSQVTDPAQLEYRNDRLLSRRPADYRKLKQAYEMLFKDLSYFPVPKSTNRQTPDITYDDTWGQPRSYRSERAHEGCDLMGPQRDRGYYPVVSMTDGVVEQVGWLELGGWRIGVRAPGGAYFYYAHLYGYAREWKTGDPVKAGELLGFMGDSGYGTEPGTVGNFDVHLHVGIYLKTDHYQELSVNPYWLLKYLEKRRLLFTY